MFQSLLSARANHLITQSFPSKIISLLGFLTLSGDAVERLGGAIQPSPPSCPKIGETSPKFLLDKYTLSLFLALFLPYGVQISPKLYIGKFSSSIPKIMFLFPCFPCLSNAGQPKQYIWRAKLPQ